MSKQYVSFVLAVILTAEVSFAGGDNGFFDGTTTGAAPSSWGSKGGGRYMYGGQYTFKFARSSTPRPVLDFELPKVNAGCNGISIQGGFIAFLGLDDIKEQLQSSGQKAIMGVVMGLVYSLPGIADAFEKVHTWVRMLQQLLRNSCQIMSQMTQNYLKDKTTFGGEALDKLNSSAKGFEGWAKGGLDSVEAGFKSVIPDMNITKREMPQKMRSAAETNPTSEIFASKTASDIALLEPNTVVEKKLSEIMPTIQDQEFKRNFLFSMMFIGYYGYPLDELSKFKDISSDAALREMTTSLFSPTSKAPKPSWQRGLAIANQSNTDKIVNILLNGNSNGTDTLEVPNIIIKRAYLQTKTSSGTANSAGTNYIALFGTADSASDTTQFPWKGMYRDTLDFVIGKINLDPGVTTNLPLVFPNGGKYITLLRTLKKDGAGDTYVHALATILARKNSLMLLESIVTEMEAMIGQVKSDSEDASRKRAIAAIYEEIKRMNDSDSSINDTVALFERIEKTHREEIAGGAKLQSKQ